MHVKYAVCVACVVGCVFCVERKVCWGGDEERRNMGREREKGEERERIEGCPETTARVCVCMCVVSLAERSSWKHRESAVAEGEFATKVPAVVDWRLKQPEREKGGGGGRSMRQRGGRSSYRQGTLRDP